MDDIEKARILAERVHGWTVYTIDGWNAICDEFDGDITRVMVIEDAGLNFGLRSVEYPTQEYYNPANNVAQAFDAIEAYRGQHLDRDCYWELVSPMVDLRDGFSYHIHMDIDDPDEDDQYPREGFMVEAATPAAAICDAIIAALEG